MFYTSMAVDNHTEAASIRSQIYRWKQAGVFINLNSISIFLLKLALDLNGSNSQHPNDPPSDFQPRPHCPRVFRTMTFQCQATVSHRRQLLRGPAAIHVL